MADFPALFPVEVISAMLGVPGPDRQQIRHWVDAMLYRETGSAEITPEGMVASLELATYFLDMVREKRRSPDDRIISRLIEVIATDADGVERRLSDDDVAGFSVLISGAGSETVTKLIGNGAALFQNCPEQWRSVLDDAGAIPGAVEEILRFNPPSQYQGRFTTEDVPFQSGTIPAGSPTLLLTGAATRDPRAFERANQFDISRNAQAALALGIGSIPAWGRGWPDSKAGLP